MELNNKSAQRCAKLISCNTLNAVKILIKSQIHIITSALHHEELMHHGVGAQHIMVKKLNI